MKRTLTLFTLAVLIAACGGPGPTPAKTWDRFGDDVIVAPREVITAIEEGWLPIRQDGTCPHGHPLKANPDSGIYHEPKHRAYTATKNPRVRCYSNPEAAEAAGFRASL